MISFRKLFNLGDGGLILVKKEHHIDTICMYSDFRGRKLTRFCTVRHFDIVSNPMVLTIENVDSCYLFALSNHNVHV
jgi:hypothetical protein